MAGAASGAALGAIAGPPGALIGGIAGGIAGSLGGEKIGEKLGASINDGLKNSGVGGALDATGKKVADLAGRAVNALPAPVKQAASYAADKAVAAKDWVLGQTSKIFESGKGGAGTVSTGKGDFGGASYGTYQMASKMGVVQDFLKKSDYGNQFAGMQPGTPEFNAKWKDVAKNDPSFGSAQHDYIKSQNYDPAVAGLKASGIDLSQRGPAVQDAIWSTGVHFGAGAKGKSRGAVGLISSALSGQDAAKMSDADIVSAIQNYKIANNDRLFASSDERNRAGTAARAVEEKKRLVSLASTNGAAPAPDSAAGAPMPSVPRAATTTQAANPLTNGPASTGGQTQKQQARSTADRAPGKSGPIPAPDIKSDAPTDSGVASPAQRRDDRATPPDAGRATYSASGDPRQSHGDPTTQPVDPGKSISASLLAGPAQAISSAEALVRSMLAPVSARPAGTMSAPSTAASVPMPSAGSIPDAPAVTIPQPTLNTDASTTSVRMTSRQPITQDLGDRSIAHIATGGLGKT